MVPAGNPTEETVTALLELLKAGDTIVDGGNSNYKNTAAFAALRRQESELPGLRHQRRRLGLDGGLQPDDWREAAAVAGCGPSLRTLAPAPDRGWGHVGPSSAGHFTKMIHNGIEYGLMQAYAEGFSVMQHKTEFAFDLHQVAEIWRHGSVVRSWLLDLTANALKTNPRLEGIAPYVADSAKGDGPSPRRSI